MRWYGRAQEWLLDHGFRIDDFGRVEIPREKWDNLALKGTVGSNNALKRLWPPYILNSPELKTLDVPEDFGLCTLVEGKDFVLI